MTTDGAFTLPTSSWACSRVGASKELAAIATREIPARHYENSPERLSPMCPVQSVTHVPAGQRGLRSSQGGARAPRPVLAKPRDRGLVPAVPAAVHTAAAAR